MLSWHSGKTEYEPYYLMDFFNAFDRNSKWECQTLCRSVSQREVHAAKTLNKIKQKSALVLHLFNLLLLRKQSFVPLALIRIHRYHENV